MNKIEKFKEEISKLSIEELENNLITCDFRGVEFKRLALDELIKRKIKTQNN